MGVEEDIAADRLFGVDEVMILGTMSGTVAITHVDGRPIGATVEIGTVTVRLKELYCEAMLKEENSYDFLKCRIYFMVYGFGMHEIFAVIEDGPTNEYLVSICIFVLKLYSN